jgi:hypothetical protein
MRGLTAGELMSSPVATISRRTGQRSRLSHVERADPPPAGH